MATGTVAVCFMVRLSATANSFQLKTKVRMAQAASPGATSGSPPNNPLTSAWARGITGTLTWVLYAVTASVTCPGAKSAVKCDTATKLPGASLPASPSPAARAR